MGPHAFWLGALADFRAINQSDCQDSSDRFSYAFGLRGPSVVFTFLGAKSTTMSSQSWEKSLFFGAFLEGSLEASHADCLRFMTPAEALGGRRL